jgi:hypothetical protein
VIKLSGDQNEATWVICRSIKPGRQKDYDDWLERYLHLKGKRLDTLERRQLSPAVVNHLCGTSSTVLLIVVRPHIGDIIAYQHGLHFCQEVYPYRNQNKV